MHEASGQQQVPSSVSSGSTSLGSFELVQPPFQARSMINRQLPGLSAGVRDRSAPLQFSLPHPSTGEPAVVRARSLPFKQKLEPQQPSLHQVLDFRYPPTGTAISAQLTPDRKCSLSNSKAILTSFHIQYRSPTPCQLQCAKQHLVLRRPYNQLA